MRPKPTRRSVRLDVRATQCYESRRIGDRGRTFDDAQHFGDLETKHIARLREQAGCVQLATDRDEDAPDLAEDARAGETQVLAVTDARLRSRDHGARNDEPHA